jgi:GGDEF domain-containing protein
MEHAQKGRVPAPTVSQGLALYPLETQDIYTLVDIADRRLYQAKERGRNEVEAGQHEREDTRPARKKARTGELRS